MKKLIIVADPMVAQLQKYLDPPSRLCTVHPKSATLRQKSNICLKNTTIFSWTANSLINTRISCRRETRATRCVTPIVWYTKVDDQRDKLASATVDVQLQNFSSPEFETNFQRKVS